MPSSSVWAGGDTDETRGIIWNGVGAPDSELGDGGDFYIDVATWEIYGPKTLSGWGGPTPLIGPQGIQGIQGIVGPQGPQGLRGPQGLTGLPGATGPQGPAGLAGPQGEDGSTILSGVGEPDFIEGNEGDYYLDTATGDLWGPKDAVLGWTTFISLKGPQGNQGNQGPIGPQGPEGPEGPITEAQFGQQNITQNTTVIAFTAAVDPTLHTNSDYIQITGIFDAIPHGSQNGVTQQTNQLTIARSGYYKTHIWASVTASNNNVNLGFRFAVNGALGLSRTPRERIGTAGDRKNIAAHGIHFFNAGDVLTLWAACDTTTNITFGDAVFSVNEMVASGIFPEIQEEGVTVSTDTEILDFVGSGVNVTEPSPGVVEIEITNSTDLVVSEEGTPVVTTNQINFVGPNVTVTDVLGEATVTLTDTTNLIVNDEGSPVVTTDEIDFVGAGVTVTDVAGVATVTIPGSNNSRTIVVACSDEITALTTGLAKVTFRMPHALTLTAVRASLTTAQASGSILTVDINEGLSSILSTKLTIDNTHKTSTTATTPAVISDSSLADDAEITIDIDQVGDGTATGLKVTLIGTLP